MLLPKPLTPGSSRSRPLYVSLFHLLFKNVNAGGDYRYQGIVGDLDWSLLASKHSLSWLSGTGNLSAIGNLFAPKSNLASQESVLLVQVALPSTLPLLGLGTLVPPVSMLLEFDDTPGSPVTCTVPVIGAESRWGSGWWELVFALRLGRGLFWCQIHLHYENTKTMTLWQGILLFLSSYRSFPRLLIFQLKPGQKYTKTMIRRYLDKETTSI